MSDAIAGFLFVMLAGGAWLLIEAGGPAPSPPAPGAVFVGTVARIVGGDAFYLTGAPARIRLQGLAAPETRTPGGAKAVRALAQITAGKRLVCEHMNADRYDRIVARCTLPSGQDVAALMIARGVAN